MLWVELHSDWIMMKTKEGDTLLQSTEGSLGIY